MLHRVNSGQTMPLSPASPRTYLHSRDITVRGYAREDGLIDIEAHLIDTKTHVTQRENGAPREPGIPLHDMWLRMTISLEREIVACEASMDATPFAPCPGAAPRFGSLAGLRIEGGFIRKAMELVGGTAGCTHLRELLQQMGTVAFQTLYSVGKMSDDPVRLGSRPPPHLNSCYAWSDAHSVVAARYPAFYTGGHAEAQTGHKAELPAALPPISI
jgi:hypothetical protein